MNLFNARVNELRDVSDRLFIELAIAVKGKGEVRKKDPGIYVRLLSATMLKPLNVEAEGIPIELRSLGRIIKNHILSRTFHPDDIAMVGKALNQPVSKVTLVEGSHGGEVGQYLAVEARGTRLAAELLVQYLECFVREPHLPKDNRLAVCARCDALFIKTKSNQEYCSQPCYFADWAEHKAKEKPDYFAEKAKRYRSTRKKRRIKKVRRA